MVHLITIIGMLIATAGNIFMAYLHNKAIKDYVVKVKGVEKLLEEITYAEQQRSEDFKTHG